MPEIRDARRHQRGTAFAIKYVVVHTKRQNALRKLGKLRRIRFRVIYFESTRGVGLFEEIEKSFFAENERNEFLRRALVFGGFGYNEPFVDVSVNVLFVRTARYGRGSDQRHFEAFGNDFLYARFEPGRAGRHQRLAVCKIHLRIGKIRAERTSAVFRRVLTADKRQKRVYGFFSRGGFIYGRACHFLESSDFFDSAVISPPGIHAVIPVVRRVYARPGERINIVARIRVRILGQFRDFIDDIEHIVHSFGDFPIMFIEKALVDDYTRHIFGKRNGIIFAVIFDIVFDFVVKRAFERHAVTERRRIHATERFEPAFGSVFSPTHGRDHDIGHLPRT